MNGGIQLRNDCKKKIIQETYRLPSDDKRNKSDFDDFRKYCKYLLAVQSCLYNRILCSKCNYHPVHIPDKIRMNQCRRYEFLENLHFSNNYSRLSNWRNFVN